MTAIANSYDSRQKKSSRDLPFVCNRLAIDFKSPEDLIRSLPFSGNDTTAGLENEFQTVVMGPADRVDLPLMIKESRYFRNIIKRARSGDNDKSLPERLRRYIEENTGNVWENSWVRFDPERLSPYAGLVFQRDLLSDKSDPHSAKRCDASAFFIRQGDENLMRIPVNYLLKLALADIIGSGPDTHSVIKVTGENLMRFYLSDNTSPEILSFYTCSHNRFTSVGEAVAGETMKRFLLTQILTQYANKKFGLIKRGQTVATYFSATPPQRQKGLNDIIPDAFYRVLSRSQLNGVAKLRDAGIITRNLVVLPNMSNISLANNGTHMSLGSRKLSALLGNKDSGFTSDHEKMIGDLVIKITEHFIPLFVGSYSASPYRLSFSDFHPEKVLAFLPHELDYTHLRMIWRRWKKKASLKVMGKTLTPFGPEWVDKNLSRMFRLKGDMVPDFRMIDYFACLMSTDESPALEGHEGNDVRLKESLNHVTETFESMELWINYRETSYREALDSLLGPEGPKAYLYRIDDRFLAENLNEDELLTLSRLLILQIYFDQKRQNTALNEKKTAAVSGTAMPLKTV